MTTATTTHRDSGTADRPLGVQVDHDGTSFAVHAVADELRLLLLHPGTLEARRVAMAPDAVDTDVWHCRVDERLVGWTYAYELSREGRTLSWIVDPRATLVREGRAYIEADGTEVAPRPELNPKDAVVYELHVRDFTLSDDGGIRPDWRGRYLGLIERGTRVADDGVSTGLDHILELGVNTVQLMPVQSFAMLYDPAYEWGYMPHDFFSPHAGYATTVDPEAPIRELKRVVSELHQHGLRVTLDIVLNHTAERWSERLRGMMALAPRSYYRFRDDGTPWDGSACGNEIRSESPHGRRFIRDCCRYWVERFGVDGFRFDLMGLIDEETMALVAADLHAIDPTILVYGEPWAAGPTPIEVNAKGTQRGRGWGVFNDELRDGLRGEVFNLEDPGFLTSGADIDAVKGGLVGGIRSFADQPTESINYIECHDNHTLADRLRVSADERRRRLSPNDEDRMARLGVLMLMTAQGIPFLHAGQEFGRSKQGHDNTYNLGDAVNNIRWQDKQERHRLFAFHRLVVKLRREHPMFRLGDRELVERAVTFLDDDHGRKLPPGVIGMLVEDPTGEDEWTRALCLFNGGVEQRRVELPEGHWTCKILSSGIDGDCQTVEGTEREFVLPPHSGGVLAEHR